MTSLLEFYVDCGFAIFRIAGAQAARGLDWLQEILLQRFKVFTETCFVPVRAVGRLIIRSLVEFLDNLRQGWYLKWVKIRDIRNRHTNASCLWVHTEWRLQQVIALLGNFHIQLGVRVTEHYFHRPCLEELTVFRRQGLGGLVALDILFCKHLKVFFELNPFLLRRLCGGFPEATEVFSHVLGGLR